MNDFITRTYVTETGSTLIEIGDKFYILTLEEQRFVMEHELQHIRARPSYNASMICSR